MTTRSRLLVALDIDGVLNPHHVAPAHAALAARLPGYIDHDVTLPASGRHLPYLRGHGTETVTGRMLVNEGHARWILSLLERGVEVSWATTWEHFANEVFGPLLGLPALPLAIEFHADVKNRHHRHCRFTATARLDLPEPRCSGSKRGSQSSTPLRSPRPSPSD
jgi:hypothetical protein